MDVRTALARAVAELEGAEAELRSAQERVNQLRTIRDGLELAVERYVSDLDGVAGRETERVVPSSDTGGAAGTPEHRTVSQAAQSEPESHTEISYDALKSLSGPQSTDEVHGRVVEHGHPLNREQVRNALTYLRKTGRIIRVAPGTWAIPSENGSTVRGAAAPGAGLSSQPAS